MPWVGAAYPRHTATESRGTEAAVEAWDEHRERAIENALFA
jgi:hypothetical protein